MISIDTVYQKVLALANKEQRGYITPLEFNLLANQAQQLIFEQYFYDLDQNKRVPTEESTFSDMEELIKNKIALFTVNSTLSNINVFPRIAGTENPPDNPNGEPDYYRTGRIYVALPTGEKYEARKVSSSEFTNIKESRFHSYGLDKNPIYRESVELDQDIEPWNGRAIDSGFVTVELVKRPEKVEWGYDVINERALYNASRSTSFKLHPSEETELVLKILGLAGIVIKQQDIAEGAAAHEAGKRQQEKV
tara:strand:- start:550 stop:1299 length:750 start_codon:yes stop_codon:yes gene_type:complete